MKAPPELEQVVLARQGKRVGREIRFQCPCPEQHSHGDADPSARYHLEKEAWYCDACKRSGGWKNLCELLGVSRRPRRDSGIVALYSYTDEGGQLLFEVVRKANPKTFRQRRPDGAGGWHWSLKGIRRVLYRLPEVVAAVREGRTVYVVEGEKDADNLTKLGLIATTNAGGAGKWSDEYSKVLRGGQVVILPDNDQPGREHARKVAESLDGIAAEVRIVDLPDLSEGGDVSDWIAARGVGADTTSELSRLVEHAHVWAPGEAADKTVARSHQYFETERGLSYWRPTHDGEVAVPLTNFLARIAGEIYHDDGAEVVCSFEIAAQHRGREYRFTISASRYASLNWATEHLGPTAVVYAGSAVRDHARVAIQLLGTEIETRTFYTHLGWRQVGGQWCYLHAGGAIGRDGRVLGVETELPGQVSSYLLPEAPSAAGLIDALRASLAILGLLDDEITIPLFAAIWRSVVGACDFSLHLAGLTGAGKTELAVLAQQHFGAGMDSRNLPGTWSSTGNSLEALAFTAKDALLLVDDFAPEGPAYEVQRQHAEASRLLRAQGNRSGRGRLRPDGTLRPVKAPRGLVVSTGEDIPKAHSIRARLLVLEVPSEALDWRLLTECQAAAREGLYAQAMAGFIRWLASQYEDVQDQLRRRVAELRFLASSGDQHRRTPSTVAELAFGLELFLRFAQAAGALSEAEAQSLWERGWQALGRAADAQGEHLASADPVQRFFELLASAIASGRAHVASDGGTEPESPEVWGWRRRVAGAGTNETEEWQAAGARVGWVEAEDLYLEPDAAYRVAQEMASVDGLSVTPTTLWKRLKERGFLVCVARTRGQNRVRVTLEGSRRSVIHVRAEAVMPRKPAQASQPARSIGKPGAPGRFSWAVSGGAEEEPAQETRPEPPESADCSSSLGPIGRVGRLPHEGGTPPGQEWSEA